MQKRMKKIVAVALVVMLTMVTVACKSGASKDSHTLVIGSMGPITGANAVYGTSVKNGATIAVDEINQKGLDGEPLGVHLELKFEDDQADAQTAANAYFRLLSEGMDVLLGATTSGACQIVNKLSERDDLLMVTPSGSANNITDPDNVYRICFTDPSQGTKIAELISKTLNYKKAAVLYDVSSDYGKGVHDQFVKDAKKNGLEIVSDQSFNSGDKDFNTQLTTIKSSGAEVIFVPGYYQDVSFILTQANQLGLNIPFIGSDGWDGVTNQLGSNATVADGAIFLSPFFSADTTPNVKNFVEEYKERFDSIPDQFAADAYDGVYAIAKAYQIAQSTESEMLIEAMKEVEVDGITGKFSFDEDGNPNKEAKYIQIENGEYTLFEY